ncbi:acetyl-CoA carboxylase biotin carboxylase subunit [Streptococcus pneumoniae]|nr:acetyl-CoA carboxylase biotin carboxylase subunit [Streptococcus pneumoniae]
MCEEVGIKFIGPSGHVMDMMGDKINARAQMIKAGVPVIPGSDGEVHNSEEALIVAEKIGYPVMQLWQWCHVHRTGYLSSSAH